MAKCRDCKLYDLDAVKNARGAVMSNRVARCLWESTETWPVSVWESTNKRPRSGYMHPNDGDRCQRFIKRIEP
jgi:hypothetical protein